LKLVRRLHEPHLGASLAWRSRLVRSGRPRLVDVLLDIQVEWVTVFVRLRRQHTRDPLDRLPFLILPALAGLLHLGILVNPLPFALYGQISLRASQRWQVLLSGANTAIR